MVGIEKYKGGMKMKSALIVQGGWEGHEPEEVSRILGNVLEENGFQVEISDTLDSYRDL